MEGDIPESVARFLAAHVRSLEQLEILLLLASDPAREWKNSEVYEVIRSSESSVRERLDELRRKGVLAPSGEQRYRYAANPETSATISALAQLYKERRVKIVELIYSPENETLRGFAEAFRFKREK